MNKTIELNTNLVRIFSGTYDTMWEPEDIGDDGQSVYLDYDHKDLMQSIAEAYKEKETVILTELNIPFIKALHFTKTFYSPREYNFSTDELDFTIEISESELMQKLQKLKTDKQFDEFLNNNYTSYDGFISFTPNQWEGLEKSIIEKDKDYERSLGAIISYLMPKADDFYASIEGIAYDYWSSNGYLGLNYTPMCWECNQEVFYKYDFNCQNEKCARYELTEEKK